MNLETIVEFESYMIGMCFFEFTTDVAHTTS